MSATRYFLLHVPESAGDRFTWDLRANLGAAAVYPDTRPGGLDPDGYTARTSVDYLLALPPERLEDIRGFIGTFAFAATELLGLELVRMMILADPVLRTYGSLRQQSVAPKFAGLGLAEVYDHPGYRAQPNFQTRLLSMTPHDGLSSPYDPFTVDDQRLERAVRNLEQIDFVGLSERYDDFLADVERRLGWSTGRGRDDALVKPDDVEHDELYERIQAENDFDRRLYEHAEQLVAERARTAPPAPGRTTVDC